MTALTPFDEHPASPGTLTGHSSSLATRAVSALTLNSSTQKAYAPVAGNWQGVGNAEAAAAPRPVSAEARKVSTSVAWASVATAYWAGCVEKFNAEVKRIVSTMNAKGPDFGVKDASKPENKGAVAAAKAAAKREAERQWHTAYDTHIVAGRAKVQSILKEGPSDALILEMFQAGLLPISIIAAFPAIDFSKTDWQKLFANLRARGVDPLTWASVGTYDPALLKQRLDLFRRMGVPPAQFKTLLQMYWVSVAAQKAGVDLSQWDPNRGAGALKDIIQKVYTYYGNLYLQNPYMQWAAMANMIGPSFAGGFMDLDMMRKIAQSLVGKPGVPVDMSVLAHLSDRELKFYETTFLDMQKQIFFDQGMMHEAYLGGGLGAMKELREAGLIDPRTEKAWGQIDEGRRTGNQSLLAAGNTYLLHREQHDIIQDEYDKMRNHPVTGKAFTYMMTAVGEASIPGTRTYAQYDPLTVEVPVGVGPKKVPLFGWDNPVQGTAKVETPLPGGNLSNLDDRWTYIEKDTLPVFQKFLREHPEEARQIIGSDVGDRIDDYRIHHRVDDIIKRLATDWDVDLDQ